MPARSTRSIGARSRCSFPAITIPNAICFSPDGAIGYFADTAKNELYRVALDPLTGLPRGTPEVLLRHRGVGGLDGAVVDADGLIWIARWGGGCVDVYSPQGERLRCLQVPARQSSCPAFVGPDFSRLLVTSAWQGMDEAARAADPEHGRTFLLEVAARGRPEPDVKLASSGQVTRPSESMPKLDRDVSCTSPDIQGSEACAGRPYCSRSRWRALPPAIGGLAQSKPTIGIAMPTKSSARWIDDGNNIVKVLKERGYGTDLQYAEDDIPNQLSQVENMVTKGAKVLVIAAIDGTTLSDVLKQAKAKGITVIAYDRLIRDTPNVDYYATFDNFQVGVLQAQSIEQGLGLKEGKGPFNIELFGGSPDDNNAYFFYNGAMSVLQPYIDSGKLVVASQQMGMDKVSTLRWDGATAQARMDNLLSAFYGKKRVDAVLSPYDGLSIGIISSLKGVGYGSSDQPMPIVSGQDAEVPSIKAMLRGEQYSTIFKDTRDLARVTVDMVDAVLSGKEVPVNDTKTYNNGVKVVPSYLLKPVVVDKSNWEKALVESGYYKRSQFQ